MLQSLFVGAPSGTRTQDPLIKSQLLSVVANTKANPMITQGFLKGKNEYIVNLAIMLNDSYGSQFPFNIQIFFTYIVILL